MSSWPTTCNTPSKSPYRRKAEKEAVSSRTVRSTGEYRPLSGCRVLVVEDEFILALELQSNLEDAGAVVVGPAFTLATALELARHADISAATLDLRLARESVAPVARVLAERRIPFLFYSGQPASDPVFAEWPRYRNVSKPAEPAKLVDAVAEMISTQH